MTVRAARTTGDMAIVCGTRNLPGSRAAIVLCVDEKSQIQALERTQPPRRVRPGRPERHTHDYLRHGTTTLFAALEVATGQVTDACQPHHRHGEFLDFLKLVDRGHPRRQLHVVLDNYATHKHAKVQAWLASHPRVHLHTSPRRLRPG
jgi:transposase